MAHVEEKCKEQRSSGQLAFNRVQSPFSPRERGAFVRKLLTFVKTILPKARERRTPRQRRSRLTVEAVLDAVVRVMKRHGVEGVTTNRIAVTAGVSIGSVYQYFPDKRAIFTALHDRHSEAIGRVIEGRLLTHAGEPLEQFVQGLVEGLVDAHASDPELHELLTTSVPHGAEGARALEARLRNAFRLAIASRARSRSLKPRDLDRMLFVLAHVVEALSHGAAYRRPPSLTLEAAKSEAVRAVLAYLRQVAPRESVAL
jgi:AcrR family transcriptional regulator